MHGPGSSGRWVSICSPPGLGLSDPVSAGIWGRRRLSSSDLAPAGLSFLQRMEKAEKVRLPGLTLSHPQRVPGLPRGRLRRTTVSLVQPGPSHLRSAENKIWVTRPGKRKLGMGAGKNCAALTCVAASCVSWSGLKPIWTFFGRWRKHLRNLKSERRGRRRNGECAPQSRKIR